MDFMTLLLKPVRAVARRGFIACAEAAFPEGCLSYPDWRETQLAEAFDPWLDALPPETRFTLEALYTTVELGGGLLGARPVPFSRMAVKRRAELINYWRSSQIVPLRFLGDAIKSSTAMLYMAHPAALRRVGVKTACEHPENETYGITRVAFPKLADLELAPQPTQE